MSNTVKLSDRLRPGIEAAPWVIEEVKKLEAQIATLEAGQPGSATTPAFVDNIVNRLHRHGQASTTPVSIKVATAQDVVEALAKKKKLVEDRETHKQRFLREFKGIKGHHLIAVMNIVTVGIEWRHCSKDYIANSYASVMLGGRISLSDRAAEGMRRLDFESARRAAIERDRDNHNWSEHYTPLPQDPGAQP